MSNYRKSRRPVLGVFSGLLFGIGVAVLLFTYSEIAIGTLTPYVIIVLGVLIGLVWSLVGPARGRPSA